MRPYNDKLKQNMAGFGPELCLFVILLVRLAGVFGAAMTIPWCMYSDSKHSRQNMATGF